MNIFRFLQSKKKVLAFSLIEFQLPHMGKFCPLNRKFIVLSSFQTTHVVQNGVSKVILEISRLMSVMKALRYKEESTS